MNEKKLKFVVVRAVSSRYEDKPNIQRTVTGACIYIKDGGHTLKTFVNIPYTLGGANIKRARGESHYFLGADSICPSVVFSCSLVRLS